MHEIESWKKDSEIDCNYKRKWKINRNLEKNREKKQRHEKSKRKISKQIEKTSWIRSKTGLKIIIYIKFREKGCFQIERSARSIPDSNER